jgi:hypothetical protein
MESVDSEVPRPARPVRALTLLFLGWALTHLSPGVAAECETRSYPIHQHIERDRSFELNIPPAYVQSISVNWHDAIGRRHEARGEVFLDDVPLGSDDIKAAGNVSVFRADRYTRLGRVTVHIRRDGAFLRSVDVTLCQRERGGAWNPPPLSRTARELSERVRDLRRDTRQEGYGEGRGEALRALASLEASADDFSRMVEEGRRGGRSTSDAYRRLQEDYRRAAWSLERARFSGRVDAQWEAVRQLMRRLDEQVDRARERRRDERRWDER